MRAALLASLLLAGCAAPFDPDAGVAPPFLLSYVADNGTEPTIGVTAEGAIFVGGGRAPASGPGSGNVGREAVYRSLDAGATWENVLADAIAQRSPADFDPWVHVDVDTGRVFDAPLYVGCSWISWSDDAGETWESNPAGGCPTPGHDHQHLTSGPPARGVTTNGYASVVYYAYASLRPGADPAINQSNPIFGSNVYEGTAVSISLDGARTFAPPVIVRAQDPCTGANDGPVAVSRDGIAYVGMPSCAGVDVAVSRDSGASWDAPVSISGTGSQLGLAMDPAIAVDASGTAHVAWVGSDDVTYVATSDDEGASWSAPRAIRVPGVNATTFTVIAALPNGTIALAYLGTSSDPATWPSFDPSDAPDDVAWHLYVTWLSRAGQVTVQATPEEDPVQRGCIWTRGGSNPCRNLGDFIGMTQHEGRVLVAYVDGCDRCASAAESRLANVLVAIEEPVSRET